MVDVQEKVIDRGGYTPRVHWVLRSDKFKTTYTMTPVEGGFAFYEFHVDSGKLPAELSGFHSSPQKAIDKFMEWERKQTKSSTVKREENRKAREKQKADKCPNTDKSQSTPSSEASSQKQAS